MGGNPPIGGPEQCLNIESILCGLMQLSRVLFFHNDAIVRLSSFSGLSVCLKSTNFYLKFSFNIKPRIDGWGLLQYGVNSSAFHVKSGSGH